MDGLRESVYLRSYGQKDPLLEYKREAHAIFTTMMESLAGEVANSLFHLSMVDPRALMDMDNATYSYNDLDNSNTSFTTKAQISDEMHMSDGEQILQAIVTAGHSVHDLLSFRLIS